MRPRLKRSGRKGGAAKEQLPYSATHHINPGFSLKTRSVGVSLKLFLSVCLLMSMFASPAFDISESDLEGGSGPALGGGYDLFSEIGSAEKENLWRKMFEWKSRHLGRKVEI